MAHHTHRRRRVSAALITAALLVGIPMIQAGAHPRSKINEGLCDIQWQRGKHQVKRLIRCSARRWHVPGGAHKALRVARCESGFNPKAYYAHNAGVFQQNLSYWPGRARKYGFRRWSAYNGRANVMVSIQMAHHVGWSPWACA